MTVSRGMKKEISEEIGCLLVDLAQLADFLETQKKLGEHADGFLEWFGTVENQVGTMSRLAAAYFDILLKHAIVGDAVNICYHNSPNLMVWFFRP